MTSRNHPSEQTGMSPYVKYRKTPYRYSDELNNWTSAIKKGNKAEADRHDRAWKKKFGINAPPANYNNEFEFMLQGVEEYDNS